MMNTHRPSRLLLTLSLCLLFLGINGIVGGVLMLSDPHGSPMGLSVSDLERTPFQSFLIPGLVLLLVWGGGSLLTLAGLWRTDWQLLAALSRRTHQHWAWVCSILLGAGLLVWLTVQVFTLPSVAAIQFILYALALLLVGLPLLPAMRRYYRLPVGGTA